MKRFAPALVAPLFIVLLITTSCNFGSETQGKVFTCLGKVGLEVLTRGEERLTFSKLLESSGSDCLDAAIAAFGPSSSDSSGVDIKPEPDMGSITSSVDSNTWQNCTDSVYRLQFDFSVPFKMIVGPQDTQGTFNQPSDASGNGDNDLVAQKLFNQYADLYAQITHPVSKGPSTSITFDVPAHTQLYLTLPIRVNYQRGEARLASSGNILPWLFTVSFEQAGDIIPHTVSNC